MIQASKKGPYERAWRRFLLLPTLFLIGCSSGTMIDSTKPAINGHESSRAKADDHKYSGFKCGTVRLGSSLPAFREQVGDGASIVQQDTKYPKFLRKYSVNLEPPVTGIQWKPSVKFVDDGSAFRLYEIEGLVLSSTGNTVRKLSAKYGKSKKEGLAHIWTKGGTKIRLIQGVDQPLLSFTHDELIDLSSAKMSEAIDRGDYVH